MTHTPTPWEVVQVDEEWFDKWPDGCWAITPARDKSKAVQFLPHIVQSAGAFSNNKANAAHIVRCVNSHDALRKACKAAVELLCSDGWDGTLGHHPDNPVPTQLRAALAAAEAVTKVKSLR